MYACVSQLDKEYFWSTGLTMMLAIDKPLPYHKKVVQRQIISFLDRVVASPSFVNATKISWMVITCFIFSGGIRLVHANFSVAWSV